MTRYRTISADSPTPWLDDGDVQLYHGDVVDTLRRLPPGIAQTCITSPPYWGLRDYQTGSWTGGDPDCDHLGQPHRTQAGFNERYFGRESGTDKQSELREPFRDTCGRCGARRVDSQLGLEASPDLYVERMVGVFREVWRVLRDDGTLWLNLGDSYAQASARAGQDNGHHEYAHTDKAFRDGRYSGGVNISAAVAGLKPKDLVGVPWRVAFALQADGWYLRSDIIWSKPNPMPESVADRPTKAHEYLFLLSKQPRYFYDADAIREENVSPEQGAHNARYAREYPIGVVEAGQNGSKGIHSRGTASGRNRRSVWTIPTEPFPEAHFATYPQALVRPCIQAGTSECGECSVCGAPWQREVAITRPDDYDPSIEAADPKFRQAMAHRGNTANSRPLGKIFADSLGSTRETTGWRTSCSCDAPTRPQTCLDPFVGSGTTALVARNHGRRCIGIDLAEPYLEIAARRLQQLSLLGTPPPDLRPTLERPRGLTGGAYAPPDQTPHSNARDVS